MVLPEINTPEEIEAFRKFEKDLQEEELQDMTPAQRKAALEFQRGGMSDEELAELAKEAPTVDNSLLLQKLTCTDRAISSGHPVSAESRALLYHYLNVMHAASAAAGAGGAAAGAGGRC